MVLEKLKALSDKYVQGIDSDIDGIITDTTTLDTITLDREKNILDELIKRNTDICSLHQENTLKTHLLAAEIIKGVQSGEDIYTLFLKAVECVGLTTGDTTILPVCKSNLEITYGYGGISNSPIEMKLQDAEKRLNNLIQAKQAESDSDVIKRIETAIKTHERQITDLRKRVQQL